MAKGQEELRYFEKHFNEICDKYDGKCIVIKNNKIVVVSDNFGKVYKLAIEKGYNCPTIFEVNRKAWEQNRI